MATFVSNIINTSFCADWNWAKLMVTSWKQVTYTKKFLSKYKQFQKPMQCAVKRFPVNCVFLIDTAEPASLLVKLKIADSYFCKCDSQLQHSSKNSLIPEGIFKYWPTWYKCWSYLPQIHILPLTRSHVSCRILWRTDQHPIHEQRVAVGQWTPESTFS